MFRKTGLLPLLETLVCCICAAGLCAAQLPAQDRLASRVTIYRDTYGIPHVFGETDQATMFGFAYAQAEDNFWRIEDNYIRSLGRQAEVQGERSLVNDRRNRTLEIPRLAREEYARMPRKMRTLLDGFARGLNAYVADHPDVHPRLLARFEPWYPLAFVRYNYYQGGFFYSSGLRPADLEVAMGDQFVRSEQLGSNGWVIGPSKSATGHAMLFINPHLSFFGPGQVYEGHVNSKESGWNFTGYTRLGFPFPYVGHNESLGWVSTDNSADQADLYAESFDDSTHYRYGRGVRRVTEWTDTIGVKTDGGVVRRAFTFRKTHHGPIIGVRDGKPLALKMAKLGGDGWLAEWYAMTHARTVVQLKTAMRPLNMLFGNVMAADARGNTFYLYNGAVPVRDARFDWSGPVDGSDPATEWRGYHKLDELPQLTNPATGWMQNCNTSPFLLTSSGNPDSSKFPRYMVTEGDNFRGFTARRILAGTPRFSWDDWVRAAFDTRVSAADSLLPAMLRDSAGAGDSARAALDLLARWDRKSDTASVAMTIFDRWRDAQRPEVSNLAALDSALASLTRDWGTWRVPWGQINRLQRIDERAAQEFSDDRPSVPVRGVGGQHGAVFTYYSWPVPGQKRRYGVAGGTYVSVVEFGPTVRRLAVHTMGESGDPKSPHFFDQAPLYARGEFRPAWFTLAEIKGHLDREYRPDRRATLMTPQEIEALPRLAPDYRIAYGKDSSQYGELRVPAGPGPQPVVVVIHGGCFKAAYASAKYFGALGDALKADGIATWNIEYRRLGEPGAGWPGTYLDVGRAVDHLRSIAPQYSLDLHRVVIVGHSAGGHLAMWAAARPRVPAASPLYMADPLTVRGVVDLAGPLDMSANIKGYEGLCRDTVITSLLGGTPATVPTHYAQASPMRLLPLGVPQVIVLGTYEEFVPLPFARAYARAATQAGDSVRLILIPGVGHFEIASPRASTWPRVESAIRSLLDGRLPPETGSW